MDGTRKHKDTRKFERIWMELTQTAKDKHGMHSLIFFLMAFLNFNFIYSCVCVTDYM